MAAKKISEKKKKQYNVKPKPRHIRVAKKISENVSLKDALLSEGYSESVAESPQRVTETKGFKQILSKYLSDEKIAKGMGELAGQIKLDYFMFPKDMEDGEIIEHMDSVGIKCVNVRQSDKGKMAFYAIPDGLLRARIYDMGLKINGGYAPEKKSHEFDDETRKVIADKVADILAV